MIGVDVEVAIDLLKEQVQLIDKTEECLLLDSLNRISGETVYAPMNNPPFDRSPLDGIALRAEDVRGATKEKGIVLTLVGEVCAGDYYEGVIESGQAVIIMTGAPIPKGANCVIRQEDILFKETTCIVYQGVRAFQNYCYEGEDIKKGSLLIEKGTCITPIHIGVLASMGIAKIRVREKLVVGVLSTGDELVEAGQELLPGQIYNANLYILVARLRELGVQPMILPKIIDDAHQVAACIAEHLPKVEILLTTGGVSVGKKDIMHKVIEILGAQRLFWKINMKPGTPMLTAKIDDKLLIALSGNPFAALVTFELIARPVMSKLAGEKRMTYQYRVATLQNQFLKSSVRRRFIRGYYQEGKVTLSQQHESGVLSTMTGCNCLVDIPAGTIGLQKDDSIQIILL